MRSSAARRGGEILHPLRRHERGINVWGSLTRLRQSAILVHMRATIEIDETLLKRAMRLTGVSQKTLLVRRGLEALIALESARRLARLGGSERELRPIGRRR